MRKLKIYLDTSVIGYLDQHDDPTRMNDTLKLWKDIQMGRYDVYISSVGLAEIGRCHEEKRNTLESFLSSIDFQTVTITEEMESLANQIIKQGILSQKSFDDCVHIAAAVAIECDIIVSWNFKHMVNIKTINGVRAINLLNGYKPIDIYSPEVLVERSENDE